MKTKNYFKSFIAVATAISIILSFSGFALAEDSCELSGCIVNVTGAVYVNSSVSISLSDNEAGYLNTAEASDLSAMIYSFETEEAEGVVVQGTETEISPEFKADIKVTADCADKYIKFAVCDKKTAQTVYSNMYKVKSNLALGANIECNDLKFFSSELQPPKMTDGDVGTRYAQREKTAFGDSEYIFDLGETYAFDTAVIRWYASNVADKYDIYVSNDKSVYDKVFSCDKTFISNNNNTTVDVFKKVTGRYIKLTASGDTHPSVYEFEIYNTDGKQINTSRYSKTDITYTSNDWVYPNESKVTVSDIIGNISVGAEISASFKMDGTDQYFSAMYVSIIKSGSKDFSTYETVAEKNTFGTQSWGGVSEDTISYTLNQNDYEKYFRVCVIPQIYKDVQGNDGQYYKNMICGEKIFSNVTSETIPAAQINTFPGVNQKLSISCNADIPDNSKYEYYVYNQNNEFEFALNGDIITSDCIGKYICGKVSDTEGNLICETRLIGPILCNLAFGAEVTSNAVQNDSYPFSNITDGFNDSVHRTAVSKRPSNNEDTYYIVDLGKTVEFNTILISWFGDTLRMTDYDLLYSTDGINYEKIFNFGNYSDIRQYTNEVIYFKPVEARYVKILRNSEFSEQFQEIEIYNTNEKFAKISFNGKETDYSGLITETNMVYPTVSAVLSGSNTSGGVLTADISLNGEDISGSGKINSITAGESYNFKYAEIMLQAASGPDFSDAVTIDEKTLEKDILQYNYTVPEEYSGKYFRALVMPVGLDSCNKTPALGGVQYNIIRVGDTVQSNILGINSDYALLNKSIEKTDLGYKSSVGIFNNTNKPLSAKLITAIYDENKRFIGCGISDVTIAANEYKEIATDIQSNESEAFVNYMLWDDNLIPLVNVN